MALAFVFPGQGSQAPGMGRDLAAAFPVAREVFEEVDEALKQKLSTLMFEGPAEELTLTANAQPALMAHSIAALRVLQKEGGFTLADKVALVAGHSLGARSALTAAGLQLHPAPVDASGLDVAYAQAQLPAPRLIYVTPSHQYPGGAVMPLARRQALLACAEAHGAWIIEDDYDSEFRYASQPVAAL